MEPKLDDVIFFQAEKMMRRAKEITKESFKHHGFEVTVDQWILLKALWDGGSLSQIQLAESTFKDPASIKRILDLLEQKGLVMRRVKDHNRKENEIELLEKGKDLVEKMMPVVQSLRDQVTQDFSSGERYALLHLLKKANKNL